MASEASLKWVWRGSALGVLALGWLFILIKNNLHITPSVIYVMLAHLAGVGAVYALFRMGAAAVGPNDDDPESWVLPRSARDELEREKRTLLKAIKNAEFDAQMNKLSKHDLEDMVRTYRLRAIDVIKLLEAGGTGSTRDQIMREVRARVEVDAVHNKVERAHAGLTKRKNPNKAAAAAQAAARAAAAAGAPPNVAAEAAKVAAIATDLDAEDVPEAGAEVKAKTKPVDAKTDEYDDIEDEIEDEIEDKIEDKIEQKIEQIAANTDDKPTNGKGKASPSDATETTPDAKAKPDAKEATP